MEWQTLAELARDCAALPKSGFKARFGAPFLLELDPEAGVIDTNGETRDFNPEKIKEGSLEPSLTKSRIVNFGEGQSFGVGRAEGNDIQVTHETVSDNHCKFESFGTIWAIAELGSKNGTFLNGRKLGSNEQSPLKFGTKIMLGEAQFLFLSTDDAFDLIQDLSKEPRIRPRSLGKYRTEFKDAGDAETVRKEFPGPFLVVQAPKGRESSGNSVSSNTITLSQEELTKGVNQNVTDAVFNLGNHSLVRIGRATVTQIHLPLGAISNLHAALIRGDDKWSIQDLGAKNGTYLWGERLEGKAELESGTEIMLGNIKSIFFNTEDLLTYALHRDSLV
jgi:pSer/pThr/pTyr-binding forkhead associated (FHA) protein